LSKVIISIVPIFFAFSVFVDLLELFPVTKMFVFLVIFVSICTPYFKSKFSNSFFVYFDVFSKSENTIILLFKTCSSLGSSWGSSWGSSGGSCLGFFLGCYTQKCHPLKIFRDITVFVL
jgi:hypothetical protein